MYKVIKFFRDLKDNGHVYKVGDVFPHDGKEISDARLSELSSCHNKQGTPLIERVPEPKGEEEKEVMPEPVKESVKTDEKPIAEEVEAEPPKKRGRKKNS